MYPEILFIATSRRKRAERREPIEEDCKVADLLIDNDLVSSSVSHA